MTREEAICCLHNPEDEDCYTVKELEAYNMAIKALKQESEEDKTREEAVALAFHFGRACGLAERYDAMDKIIEEIRKIVKDAGWVEG